MMHESAVAGKRPPDRDLSALLARRQAVLSDLESIDDALERLGVRAVEKPKGIPRTVSLLLIEALSAGPLALRAIAARTGQTEHACAQMLSKLTALGELRRVGRGLYGLPERAS